MTNQPVNPIDAAFAATPSWMLTIRDYDAIEVHPCRIVDRTDGIESVEQCQPEAAEFWSVYGHCIDGGIHSFEDDFPTEAEADAFAATLRRTYPHLAEGGAP